MKDPLQKRFELWFRRLVVHLFGIIVQRNTIFCSTIDFNTCKFLFIRQDRIGDVLISTPLFAVLKKHYPGAMIDILLGKNNYFVLDNEPLIRKRWIYRKQFGKFFSLIRALRGEHYDFVIDLMDNPSVTSTFLCLLIHATWNVGIAKDNSFAYDITVPMLSRRENHIIERLAQLLIPFHIHPFSEQLNVRYYPTSASNDVAERFLQQNNLMSRPLIGVNISAGSDVRFWGIENFKQLLNYIQQTYSGYQSLVLYQPADEERARKIVESHPTALLSPVTSSFDQFAAFVKRLSYIITPDTAAVHLASAFNIGAVVMYVQSNKELRIWEPYGTDSECIVTEVDDLSTITIIQVQDALQRLLLRKRIPHEPDTRTKKNE